MEDYVVTVTLVPLKFRIKASTIKEAQEKGLKEFSKYDLNKNAKADTAVAIPKQLHDTFN